LFTIFQLSSTVFAFFALSTIGGSLSFSVLFLLFCYFNILFYSWHCIYSLQTVYAMLTSSVNIEIAAICKILAHKFCFFSVFEKKARHKIHHIFDNEAETKI